MRRAMMVARASSSPIATQPLPTAVLGSKLLAWYRRGHGIYDATSSGSLVTTLNQDVKRWEDQSGNGYHMTTPSAALQWKPDTTQVDAGTIGALSGDAYFALPDALMTALNLAGEGEIWVCWKASSASGGGTSGGNGLWAMGNVATTVVDHYEYLDGNIYDSWGSTARSTIGAPGIDISSAFHVYDVYSKTSDKKAFINNSQIFTTGSNTVGFKATNAWFLHGHNTTFPGTDFYWRGWVSDVVISNAKATTGERLGIYTYQTSF